MPIHESIQAIAPDFKKIYVVEFATDQPKGLVLLIHGLGEHVRRYDAQLEYFNRHGYSVLAADLVGHGRTEGRRGVWSSMEENYAIIDQLFLVGTKKYPALPLYVYGHSMGGNIAARYMMLRKPKIQGLILTGSALKTGKDLPRALVRLVMAGPSWIKNITIANGLNLKSLCNDVEVVQRYIADPLVHNRISIGAGATILENAYALLSQKWQPPFPVLLMHGEKDQITLVEGSAALSMLWEGQIEFRIWQGMLHEIHNEPEKIKVWDYIIDWLNKTQVHHQS